MQKKKSNISFDAMVRFFMQTYEIPTKTDIDRLTEQIERLERLITATVTQQQNRGKTHKGVKFKATLSATEEVYEVVKSTAEGATINDIQARTNFDEKKIRNAIFRLNKLGRIKRKKRGVYVAVEA